MANVTLTPFTLEFLTGSKMNLYDFVKVLLLIFEREIKNL